MNKILRIATIAILEIETSLATAETYTVCDRGCDFTNIQDAVSAANHGDTILISAGEYSPFWGHNKDLAYHGGPGTIITSGIPAPGGCSHLFQANDIREIGNSTFENIEFKWLHGGGIQAEGNTLAFQNCTFNACTSSGGKASCAAAASLFFEDCIFAHNVHVATSNGPNPLYGGLIIGQSVISSCHFQSNCGMISSDNATLQGSVVCDHSEAGAAYFIFGRSNSLELIGCVVSNSQTECFIEDRNRPYTATGCFFACNQPANGDGYFFGSKATLVDTSICNEACDTADCDNHGGSTGNCNPDCNNNGVVDVIELINGQTSDYDGNWIPDACECLADLNLDAAVGAADLGLLVAAWGDASVFPQADLNRDKNIDANDLGLLLGAWGMCP